MVTFGSTILHPPPSPPQFRIAILFYQKLKLGFKLDVNVGARADFSKSLVVEAFICNAGNIGKIPALGGFKSMYLYFESDAKRIEFSLHPGQTFAERLMGNFSLAVPVFVALSCFGSMNGGVFAVSRMFFVASREGHLPEILSMIHVRKHTPLPAVIVLHPLTMIMLFNGDLYSLLNFLSFARWLFIGLVVAGLIYLRYKRPDMPRPFKVPLFIPALFSFTCLFMVALSLYSDPVNTGIGFAITLTGIPAYYLFIVWDNKPKWFRKLLERSLPSVVPLLNGEDSSAGQGMEGDTGDGLVSFKNCRKEKCLFQDLCRDTGADFLLLHIYALGHCKWPPRLIVSKLASEKIEKVQTIFQTEEKAFSKSIILKATVLSHTEWALEENMSGVFMSSGTILEVNVGARKDSDLMLQKRQFIIYPGKYVNDNKLR
ncbi:hypothetical protein DUI87_23899 [Hirundo rustica rustica]|uniref:Amino acid permease/ SLC12A domain-containing protein n=1 Tax=Hirundo rustica rustica TaxID=333673 RepID=A0A3M0JXL2_HIRRU|nr:hypothetical protein DUI87_23899 [Hirundo rustica rustica]